MSAIIRIQRKPPAIAVAAVTAFAALALSRCELDTTILRCHSDSGQAAQDAAEEATAPGVQLTSFYAGKPCMIIEGLNLSKGETRELLPGISINLNDIVLEDRKPVASLTVLAKGEKPNGVFTIHWSSLAHLKVREGIFKQFSMGLDGEIIVSLIPGTISAGSIILDISVCGIG